MQIVRELARVSASAVIKRDLLGTYGPQIAHNKETIILI